jgi:hypothetical protein
MVAFILTCRADSPVPGRVRRLVDLGAPRTGG